MVQKTRGGARDKGWSKRKWVVYKTRSSPRNRGGPIDKGLSTTEKGWSKRQGMINNKKSGLRDKG